MDCVTLLSTHNTQREEEEEDHHHHHHHPLLAFDVGDKKIVVCVLFHRHEATPPRGGALASLVVGVVSRWRRSFPFLGEEDTPRCF